MFIDEYELGQIFPNIGNARRADPSCQGPDDALARDRPRVHERESDKSHVVSRLPAGSHACLIVSGISAERVTFAECTGAGIGSSNMPPEEIGKATAR